MVKQSFSNFSNLEFIESLQKDYQDNPDSLDPSWQAFFEGIQIGAEGSNSSSSSLSEADKDSIGELNQKVSLLINAYRKYGHLLADVNPIDTDKERKIPELEISSYGLKEDDLDKQVKSLHFFPGEHISLRKIISALKETYCDKVGIEYMEVQNTQIEKFIQGKIESNRFKVQLDFEEKKMILELLNRSGLFENFLHTKYVGQKRFSLEGGETLIPIMAAVIEKASSAGTEHFYVGMAHRGRLNVLSNILNKAHGEIFSEFEDSYIPDSVEGGGDVKYHKGYHSIYKTRTGKDVKVNLAANPSHLEAVNGVVLGEARGKQVEIGDEIEMKKVVPLLLHGDAAIAGQGIIYETMQFCGLPGYKTGGTVHIVINNQIGFTTLPKDSRSTRYCTDIAKTFGAPVFHVNAEDPESCVFAANLAMEIRSKFQTDVFIDINCYRKFGHNEGDEPAFTQPLEYKLIRKKRAVREIYRDYLISQGVLEKELAENLEEDFKTAMQESLSKTKEGSSKVSKKVKSKAVSPFDEKEMLKPVDTRVSKEILESLTKKLSFVPEGFALHKKVQRLLKDRERMISGEKTDNAIDWGLGEHLAFATLLNEGTHVRLSGQDARRGTFSHRHAVWMDQNNAKKHFPLNHINPGKGRFDVFNSPLSEYGILGFEYGYSLNNPNALVIWEAQFGDFCNGAQIIIDQFISTGEHKWSTSVPLTLLLPHGYEGQGPEHSSARMERFLQLSGAANMQVAQPSTPAQLFHLLRRQVLASFKKPLIIFTPKGLLRHKLCMSSIQDLTDGSFEEILDDSRSDGSEESIVLCSGRMFYNLIEEKEKGAFKKAALVRIEQFFPLHTDKLRDILEKYKKLKQVIWIQDEPKNMGAWDYIRIRLEKLIAGKFPFRCVGRERSASPAVGSFSQHTKEYQQLTSQLSSLVGE
jgi:2-oxoglutarate dehydrogenase E1 component